MIEVSNVKRQDNVPFEQYLIQEGYSHSFLKYQRYGILEPKEVTSNMRIGSLVDGIITEPDKVSYKDPLYSFAKNIVSDLKAKYGDMIKLFDKQVSYSATFKLGEFVLLVKGRLDFLLDKEAVIDLKITFSKDVVGLIDYFGYKNQVWGYAKMAGVPKSYIMIYSVPLRKSFIYEVNIGQDNYFWEEQILNFGNVV